MAQFSYSPVFWSLMCSPAHTLAQGPAVNGQHPLTLSLRTNSMGESLPGSPQSSLTQLGIHLPGCLWSEVTLLFGKAQQMPCATLPPSGVRLFCCSELDL